jgi:hypothetical protein
MRLREYLITNGSAHGEAKGLTGHGLADADPRNRGSTHILWGLYAIPLQFLPYGYAINANAGLAWKIKKMSDSLKEYLRFSMY